MGDSKAKRFTGCLCGCGEGTWATYRPGHDAKHVSQLAASIVETWGTYDTTTRYRNAMRLLSPALKAKLRRRMQAIARKHLGDIVTEMCSPEWQKQIGLQRLVARSDAFYDGPARSFVAVAETAAAMGWSRYSVNVCRS